MRIAKGTADLDGENAAEVGDQERRIEEYVKSAVKRDGTAPTAKAQYRPANDEIADLDGAPCEIALQRTGCQIACTREHVEECGEDWEPAQVAVLHIERDRAFEVRFGAALLAKRDVRRDAPRDVAAAAGELSQVASYQVKFAREIDFRAPRPVSWTALSGPGRLR